MKTLFKIFTSKIFVLGLLIIFQLAVFALSLLILAESVPYYYVVTTVVAVIFVLYIIGADINPAYKIAWIVPILAMPIFGVFAYIIFGRKKLSRRQIKRYRKALDGIEDLLEQDGELLSEIKKEDEFFYNMSRYVYEDSKFPVHAAKEIAYFKSGEDFFERLKTELKNAEKFIFLEFFIIERGKMWGEILEILKEKSATGVDVRLIYDDVGTILKLPHNYAAYLNKLGIKTLLFNPFRPIVDVQINNRTHRKIVVIDNNCAFTGGINLADEYINEKKLFGHWKDTGICITGCGVKNFTLMFLELWALKYGHESFDKFEIAAETSETNEYIVPFSDSPFDGKNIYENVYIKTIYNAKEYVFINTPYLILDNEMKTALITAAKSGVDVRITVPYKPDKKTVFLLTKAFYTELLKEGVKIYRYLPGFIHAKSMVSDGKYSVIGTSNMDFRSFYMHFECGAVIYSQKTAGEITADFLETALISKQVTLENSKTGLIRRLFQAVLRLFAPML